MGLRLFVVALGYFCFLFFPLPDLPVYMFVYVLCLLVWSIYVFVIYVFNTLYFVIFAYGYVVTVLYDFVTVLLNLYQYGQCKTGLFN